MTSFFIVGRSLLVRALLVGSLERGSLLVGTWLVGTFLDCGLKYEFMMNDVEFHFHIFTLAY